MPQRERLLEHQHRQHEAEHRGGARMDHAAMRQRREDESGIADDRLERPGEQEHHQPAAPADAAEVAQPVAQDERQQHQSGPHEAMERDVGGDSPAARPRGIATKPAAQNSAAPAPQSTPMVSPGAIDREEGGSAVGHGCSRRGAGTAARTHPIEAAVALAQHHEREEPRMVALRPRIASICPKMIASDGAVQPLESDQKSSGSKGNHGPPMSHHTPLITMIVVGLVLAFALGALAHRLRIVAAGRLSARRRAGRAVHARLRGRPGASPTSSPRSASSC